MLWSINSSPMNQHKDYQENYWYESWQDKPNLMEYSIQQPSCTDVKLDPIMKSESGTFMNGRFPNLHIFISQMLKTNSGCKCSPDKPHIKDYTQKVANF